MHREPRNGNRLQSFIFIFSRASLLSDSLLTLLMNVGKLPSLSFRGLIALIVLIVCSFASNAQPVSLSLPEAIELGIEHYQLIEAKRNYLNASQALQKNARSEYLPNVIASVQQNYGTVNGQFGPLAAVGVLGVASGGPSASAESWNAA